MNFDSAYQTLTSPAAVASSICLAAAVYLGRQYVFPRKPSLNFPVVLVEGMDNRTAVEFGYAQVSRHAIPLPWGYADDEF